MSAFTGLLSLHEAALIWNIDDSTIRKAVMDEDTFLMD